MKTIFYNGMIKDVPYFLDETDAFGIQESDDIKLNNGIFYAGDSVNYMLDGRLVDLYDVFRDILFKDVDQYYKEVASLPIWVQEAGQSSSLYISASTFSEYVRQSTEPNLFRHLYLVDCQFLVGTVQNLLCAIEFAFVSYYQLIASLTVEEHHKKRAEKDETIIILSSRVTQISNTIETYFTKAYSILDIMCKICYEIQNILTEFKEYQKIKSAKVLWGERKKLRINGARGTIFESCELISNIEAIRNEIVHNGTWELNPKGYIRFENGEEAEKYMLFPDMEQGHLATVKSRRHFFSSNVKINNILPRIHYEFKGRLLSTLDAIDKIYLTE